MPNTQRNEQTSNNVYWAFLPGDMLLLKSSLSTWPQFFRIPEVEVFVHELPKSNESIFLQGEGINGGPRTSPILHLDISLFPGEPH